MGERCGGRGKNIVENWWLVGGSVRCGGNNGMMRVLHGGVAW